MPAAAPGGAPSYEDGVGSLSVRGFEWPRHRISLRKHGGVIETTREDSAETPAARPSSLCVWAGAEPASEPPLLKARQLSDRVVCHNVIGILCQSDAWETRVWGIFEQRLAPLFLDKLRWRAAAKDKGTFIITPDLHPHHHPFSKQLEYHLLFLLWELNVTNFYFCIYSFLRLFKQKLVNTYIYSHVPFFCGSGRIRMSKGCFLRNRRGPTIAQLHIRGNVT